MAGDSNETAKSKQLKHISNKTLTSINSKFMSSFQSSTDKEMKGVVQI
jgi:hypothetical protein